MSKRLFAGVSVEATDALRELAENLRQALRNERIRWDRLDHPHATVWFFGAVEETRIPELERALEVAASGVSAFNMKIQGLGTFGSARRPGVVWLGIESESGLRQLFAALVAPLAAGGWPPEPREFAPHLTLGRISGLRDMRLFRETLERYREAVVQAQSVQELILYESVLGRGGAKHVPLGRFALKWPPGANRA
jgi:2'-5' RNA ligase